MEVHAFESQHWDGRGGQICESEARPVYIVGSRPARATHSDPVSKQTKTLRDGEPCAVRSRW